jgi:hypothetical protein
VSIERVGEREAGSAGARDPTRQDIGYAATPPMP